MGGGGDKIQLNLIYLDLSTCT